MKYHFFRRYGTLILYISRRVINAALRHSTVVITAVIGFQYFRETFVLCFRRYVSRERYVQM